MGGLHRLRIETVFRGRTCVRERALHELVAAVADPVANLFRPDRLLALLFQGRIDGRSEIRHRVDQRTVEVEGDELDIVQRRVARAPRMSRFVRTQATVH